MEEASRPKWAANHARTSHGGTTRRPAQTLAGVNGAPLRATPFGVKAKPSCTTHQAVPTEHSIRETACGSRGFKETVRGMFETNGVFLVRRGAER